VTGIGFLGAGAIIQGGRDVRGLTTGAGIWVSGGIGLACGGGYFAIAGVVTAFVLLVLFVAGWFERRMLRDSGESD
jgi:putative Mg2+ transporter-C (MgtC) family protein